MNKIEKVGPPPQFLAITRKDIFFGEEDDLLLSINLPVFVKNSTGGHMIEKMIPDLYWDNEYWSIRKSGINNLQ